MTLACPKLYDYGYNIQSWLFGTESQEVFGSGWLYVRVVPKQRTFSISFFADLRARAFLRLGKCFSATVSSPFNGENLQVSYVV